MVADHFRSVEDRGGYVPELHPDPPPPQVVYLWGWFLEMHRARSGSGFGPNALSYSEIAAWASLSGLKPTPWEVGVLRKLDSAFLSVVARHAKDNN